MPAYAADAARLVEDLHTILEHRVEELTNRLAAALGDLETANARVETLRAQLAALERVNREKDGPERRRLTGALAKAAFAVLASATALGVGVIDADAQRDAARISAAGSASTIEDAGALASLLAEECGAP